MKRRTIGDRIADELKAHGFGGIAWGDDRLIFQIAHDTGIAPMREDEYAWNYVKRILAAVDRCDRFEKRLFENHFGPHNQRRLIRSYRLEDADENA